MNKEMFTYKGKVRIIKKTRGGHVYELKINNHGTPKLFRGLCFALCGISLDEYKPKYITLWKSVNIEDSTETIYEILSVESHVDGSVDLTEIVAKFTGSIASYQFQEVAQTGKVYLCLLSGHEGSVTPRDRLLAYLEVTNDGIANGITPGTVLNVEWKMSFENKEQQE